MECVPIVVFHIPLCFVLIVISHSDHFEQQLIIINSLHILFYNNYILTFLYSVFLDQNPMGNDANQEPFLTF